MKTFKMKYKDTPIPPTNIDIKLTKIDWYVGEMYIDSTDTDDIIYIGQDMEMAESQLHLYRFDIKGLYGSVGRYYENEAERMINHETIHRVLLKIGGFGTSTRFDNICKPPYHEISNP